MTTKEQKLRRTEGRVSWTKGSYPTCGVEGVRRCGIGETEKQKVEE